MAFRIQDSVVRGEIDNRVRGIVRGKIRVEGRAEPVRLELKGNAHQADELGLEKWEDKDLDQFIFEFQTAGVKLAGALDGIAQGHGPHDGAFTVACLKRAPGHLHKAQAGLEAVALKRLVPEKTVSEARKELFEIREGILRLMDEFRGRK